MLPLDLVLKVDLALAEHPSRDLLRAKMLSAEEAEEFERALSRVPGSRKRCELMVEYATDRGGLILELLQLSDGPCWGTAVVLTMDQCARALGIDEAELILLYEEMLQSIWPALKASPEFQAGDSSG